MKGKDNYLSFEGARASVQAIELGSQKERSEGVGGRKADGPQTGPPTHPTRTREGVRGTATTAVDRLGHATERATARHHVPPQVLPFPPRTKSQYGPRGHVRQGLATMRATRRSSLTPLPRRTRRRT